MAKRLGFIVILSMCLLFLKFAHAQEDSLSPAVSPGRDSLADSPLPPPSSPDEDSLQPPASSPDEEDSPLPPSSSPEADSLQPPASSPDEDSPLPPSSSPEADSPQPPASSPHLSPSGPSPPPPQQESPSPSPGPAPVPSTSDYDDTDDDSDPETEYFPSPAPSPSPELGIPDDIKASEEGSDEFNDQKDEDSGMSGLKKAGIAIGAILGVGAIVIGALVYKKRRDNMTRARYTYFTEGEFL